MEHLLNCHGEWNVLLQTLPCLGGILVVLRNLPFLRHLGHTHASGSCDGHK